jgi:hypothetical protein
MSRAGNRAPSRAGGSRMPMTMDDDVSSMAKRDQRHQQLAMLRDQLRQNNSNNSLSNPTCTPRSSRPDSVASAMNDAMSTTPRRSGVTASATTASNFKPVYD